MAAIDKFLIVPFAACTYALIVYPLLLVSCDLHDMNCLLEPRPENRIFWPIVGGISVYWALRNWPRLSLPPHIVLLYAQLALAGFSVLWAFKPETSLIRFLQECMVITSIVVPALIASRRSDLMYVLFVCFAIATFLNAGFAFNGPGAFAKEATPGYTGYFSGKNYLGIFAAITVLLALYECRNPGGRRVLGILVAIVAVVLLVISNSRTALGLAVVAPCFAVLLLFARRLTGLSPAVIPWLLIGGYAIFSSVTNFSIFRVSYILFGEPTFTGRQFIWEFALKEINLRPILGWGYQSFWLVGPDAPSVVDAPGWIGTMPNAHNGYLDVAIETGFVGLALLVAFITMTVHLSGRLIDRDPARGWLVLSLAFLMIGHNGLESTWMRAFEFPWVVFLFAVAEIGRFSHQAQRQAVTQRAGPVRAARRSGWLPGHGTRPAAMKPLRARRRGTPPNYSKRELGPVGAD